MKFIQAANYTPANARAINLLVIHDMEFPETLTAAEDVANYFAHQTKGPNGSSAHYCLDADSAVHCVRDHDVAWAAPGANHDGLHFEFAGRASQTHQQWRDKFDTEMLDLGAKLFARKANQYRIPMHIVEADGLRRGHSGITTHKYITDSGIGGSAGTHQDPGPNFPIHDFVQNVRRHHRELFG